MTGIVAPARIAPRRPAASRKSRSATPVHVARSVAITAQRHRRGEHAGDVEWLALHGDVIEQEREVDDRAADERPAHIDEAPIVDVLVIDPRAERGLAGEKIGGVDRPGRRAVDRVEGVDEPSASSAETMPAETTPRIAPPSTASATLAPSPCGTPAVAGGTPPQDLERQDGSFGVLEDLLRHLHVHADVRQIHELRDRDVPGHAGELIRLVLRQALASATRKSIIS